MVVIPSTLLGILAQRLVRVNCSHCKEPVVPEERLIQSMKLGQNELEGVTFLQGKGCDKCRNTGYSGRKAIFEYLPIDDDIRNEINASSSTEKIKKVAIGKGLRTLRQDGWGKVKEGITTISEVLRVTLEI